MKRSLILMALLVLPSALSSEEQPWEVMQGPEIIAALVGRILENEDGDWIAFQPAGLAQYSTATTQKSLLWRVRNNSLCVKLSDANRWGCYLYVARQGDNLRFVGGPGDATDFTYRK